MVPLRSVEVQIIAATAKPCDKGKEKTTWTQKGAFYRRSRSGLLLQLNIFWSYSSFFAFSVSLSLVLPIFGIKKRSERVSGRDENPGFSKSQTQQRGSVPNRSSDRPWVEEALIGDWLQSIVIMFLRNAALAWCCCCCLIASSFRIISRSSSLSLSLSLQAKIRMTYYTSG